MTFQCEKLAFRTLFLGVGLIDNPCIINKFITVYKYYEMYHKSYSSEIPPFHACPTQSHSHALTNIPKESYVFLNTVLHISCFVMSPCHLMKTAFITVDFSIFIAWISFSQGKWVWIKHNSSYDTTNVWRFIKYETCDAMYSWTACS